MKQNNSNANKPAATVYPGETAIYCCECADLVGSSSCEITATSPTMCEACHDSHLDEVEAQKPAARAKMTDSTKLPEFDCDHVDECPQHGNPTRKQYEYSGGQAANVWTYKGCACAVAQQTDLGGLGIYPGVYFTTYGKAAGLAEMVQAEYRGRGLIR